MQMPATSSSSSSSITQCDSKPEAVISESLTRCQGGSCKQLINLCDIHRPLHPIRSSNIHLFINVAMPSKETDPLLPNGKATPEISYTTLPESNGTLIYPYGDEHEDNEEREADKHSFAVSCFANIVLFLCFLCFWLLVGLSFQGLKALWRDLFSVPLTMDQRVSKILSQTPLIGWFIPLLWNYTN